MASETAWKIAFCESNFSGDKKQCLERGRELRRALPQVERRLYETKENAERTAKELEAKTGIKLLVREVITCIGFIK
jgi:hypothetical protein